VVTPIFPLVLKQSDFLSNLGRKRNKSASVTEEKKENHVGQDSVPVSNPPILVRNSVLVFQRAKILSIARKKKKQSVSASAKKGRRKPDAKFHLPSSAPAMFVLGPMRSVST